MSDDSLDTIFFDILSTNNGAVQRPSYVGCILLYSVYRSYELYSGSLFLCVDGLNIHPPLVAFSAFDNKCVILISSGVMLRNFIDSNVR